MKPLDLKIPLKNENPKIKLQKSLPLQPFGLRTRLEAFPQPLNPQQSLETQKWMCEREREVRDSFFSPSKCVMFSNPNFMLYILKGKSDLEVDILLK